MVIQPGKEDPWKAELVFLSFIDPNVQTRPEENQNGMHNVHTHPLIYSASEPHRHHRESAEESTV